MSERRVVITGIGVLSPLGSELELFWQNITAGKSGIGPVTRFDTTQYECKFGGEVRDFNPEEWMPVKEARRTDRFVQYAVGAAKKANATPTANASATNTAAGKRKAKPAASATPNLDHAA